MFLLCGAFISRWSFEMTIHVPDPHLTLGGQSLVRSGTLPAVRSLGDLVEMSCTCAVYLQGKISWLLTASDLSKKKFFFKYQPCGRTKGDPQPC